jgi:hypothetical protein
MGGLFSNAELPAQIYWGTWTFKKRGPVGKAQVAKQIIIYPNGTVCCKGIITDADGNTSKYDTGAIQVNGWVDPGSSFEPSLIMGGVFTGISKRLQMSPLGDLHVLTDESAESMCVSGRAAAEPMVAETYRKKD